jgi:hypothetical protein
MRTLRLLPLALLAIGAIGAAACTQPPERCVPAGTETRTYRLTRLHLPAGDHDLAVAIADGAEPRNRLGVIHQALLGHRMDLQPAVDEAMAAGAWPVTLSVTSTDYAQRDAAGAQVTLRHGTDESSTVCGALVAGSYESVPPAHAAAPSTLTLPWPFFGERPITLTAAHVTLRPSLFDGVEGEIHGAITVAELERAVLPQVAALMTAKQNGDPRSVLAEALSDYVDVGNCANRDGTPAAARDRRIDPCEIGASIVRGLFQPDLDLFDANGAWAPRAGSPVEERDALSFGVAFHALP